MTIGDRVRLRPASRLRELLGASSERVGTVGAVRGRLIWVDYPEVPAYLQAVRAQEFELVRSDPSTAR